MAERDTAGDSGRRQHQLLSQQVPGKPGRNCERYSGETGALWLSGLLLSTLQGCCFGFTSIFPLPTRCLRECAEESSGLFKVWKQHGKLLPCMKLNGIANWTHSSLCKEMQAGLRKLPCERQWEFLAQAPLALNVFSSCPAFCYWEIICTWILLLFSIWEKNRVHPPVVLTDGISFSSALEVVR